MRPHVLSPLLLPALISAAGSVGCHGGTAGPDADEAVACMTSGRGDTFAVGLQHTGMNSLYNFKLMSADPSPPSRQQLGTWVIQINWEATGAPVTGAALTVSPFMPDHQHGPGAYTPQIMEQATPGQYQISQINTWMPGYWEITIDAITSAPSKVEDTAIFKVCVNA